MTTPRALTRSLLNSALSAAVAACVLTATVSVPGSEAGRVAGDAHDLALAAATTAATTTATTPSPYGTRTATGCTGDGTTGKRIQVIYAVPADGTDRFDTMQPALQRYLREVDSIFVSSSLRNGGGTRQVRWVHDQNCQPVITHAVVPVYVDPTGGVHRVDGATIGDTIQALRSAGYLPATTDPTRKYLVLVDNKATTTTCGVSTGVNNSDTSAGSSNANNNGGAAARVDKSCWVGSLDADNYERHSTIAHELMHILGAVLPGAPHYTSSGHCTDNFDLVCYRDSTSGAGSANPMLDPPPCTAETDENLFDCGGDDYFSTAPKSGSWLAGHWNTANSSFLYTPAAPAVAAVSDPWVPGLPARLTATPDVASGQGWRLDYKITAGTPALSFCSLTRTGAKSDEVDATGNTLLCPATSTTSRVRTTVTQEDTQSGYTDTNLTLGNATRATELTLTPSTSPVLRGATLTLTALATDPVTGQPVYGLPVHFATRSAGGDTALVDATTDKSGLASLNVVAEHTSRYVASTATTGPWQQASATTDVIAQIPTTLSTDTESRYVPSGTSVEVTGRLADETGSPAGNQPVSLWQHTTGWQQVGTGTTDAQGHVSMAATVTTDATYQLRYAGLGDYLPATGAEVRLAPLQVTTLNGATAASTINAGSTVSVTGTLSGRDGGLAGRPVELWFRTNDTWTKVGTSTTSGTGTVTWTNKPTRTGAFQLRFAAADQYQAALSADLPVTVMQPTTLTLTGPTSVPIGNEATLNATLSAPEGPLAGRTIELWQVQGSGNTLVASALSGTDGTVAFRQVAYDTATYQLRTAAAGEYTAAASTPATVYAVRGTELLWGATTPTATYGSPVHLEGQLNTVFAEDSTGAGGRTVQLWGTTEGNRTLRASGTTDDQGHVSFEVKATATSTFDLVHGGGPETGPSSSDQITLTVTRPTSVTLNASATTLTSGSSVTLAGKLTYEGTSTPVPYQNIEILGDVDGHTIELSSPSTGADGTFRFTLAPHFSGTYKAIYRGGSVLGATTTGAHTSRTVSVAVRWQVSIATATAPADDTAYAVTGAIVPATAGRSVTLYRNGAKVATARTDAAGHYRLSIRYPRRGLYRLYTRVAGTASNATSSSRVVTVRAHS